MKVTLGDFSVIHLEEAEIEIDCEGKVESESHGFKENALEILLDTDHHSTRSLLVGRKPKVCESTPSKVRSITRAQSKTREREWVDSIAEDARDGAVSKQVKLAASTSNSPVWQGKGKIQAEFTTCGGRSTRRHHPSFNPKFLPSDRGMGRSNGG